MLTRRLLHLRTRLPARVPTQWPRLPLRHYATGPQAQQDASRNRAAVGTFDWRAAAVFVVTGIGLYAYFEHEKAQVQERKRKEIKSQKYGKALVGGPFSLISAGSGDVFTEKDLLGHWSLVYFGFTNCPDICPDELDKMSAVVNVLDSRHGGKGEDAVLPVFISCDPARDTVKEVKKYIADFHPKMVGLTGSYEDVKATCRTYRVYFSTPPNMKPGDDYLVDHSIFFYLMDPAGQFVDAFGKTSTVEDVCSKFEEARLDWQERQSSRGVGVQAK